MPNPYNILLFTPVLVTVALEGEPQESCPLGLSLLQTTYRRPSAYKHKHHKYEPAELSLVQLGSEESSAPTEDSSQHQSLQETQHLSKKASKKTTKKTATKPPTTSIKKISNVPSAPISIANQTLVTKSAWVESDFSPVSAKDSTETTHSTLDLGGHETAAESVLREISKNPEDIAFPLLRLFLTVFLGMLIVRSHAVTTSDMKSIGFVVARISLPLLVFRVVVTMDSSRINVVLLLALIASRMLLQCGTAVVSALASSTQPGARLLNAGLYGFYVTAADDLSLGFVLVSTVYPLDLYPQNFPAYLVCLAVFQAVVSNSIALVFMEMGAAARDPGSESARLGTAGIIWLIIKNATRNPLVPVVCSGVVFKMVLGNTLEVMPNETLRLPTGLHDLLDVAVLPFQFLAPLQVGMRIGTQSGIFSDMSGLLLGATLNILKVALCPFLACLFIGLSEYWAPSLGQVEFVNVLRFAVLCGGIPTSATPLVLAGVYRVGEKLITGTVMVNFFIAGPLMFLGCIFAAIPDLAKIEGGVIAVHDVIEVPSILGALFTLALFLHGGPRWRTVPGIVFMHLAGSTVLAGLSRRLLNSGSCDVMAQYTAQVYFRQQARLWGVALPWVHLAHKCGVPDGLIHAETLALMYLVPLGLALPFGRRMARLANGPFAPEPCLFLYGDAETQLDLVVCVVSLVLLALAYVALAFQHRRKAAATASAKTRNAQASSSIGSPMPSWALAMTASCQFGRNEKSIEAVCKRSDMWETLGEQEQERQELPIAIPWEHEVAVSSYMYEFSSHHSGFMPQPFLEMQQRLTEDAEDDVDERWHRDTFVFPVAVVGTYTVVALLLDALLAFQVHSAAGPALLLLSSTFEALRGVLLMVIFGLSKQAVVSYKEFWSQLPWAN